MKAATDSDEGEPTEMIEKAVSDISAVSPGNMSDRKCEPIPDNLTDFSDIYKTSISPPRPDDSQQIQALHSALEEAQTWAAEGNSEKIEELLQFHPGNSKLIVFLARSNEIRRKLQEAVQRAAEAADDGNVEQVQQCKNQWPKSPLFDPLLSKSQLVRANLHKALKASEEAAASGNTQAIQSWIQQFPKYAPLQALLAEASIVKQAMKASQEGNEVEVQSLMIQHPKIAILQNLLLKARQNNPANKPKPVEIASSWTLVIHAKYQNNCIEKKLIQKTIGIGRPDGKSIPDLDLSPDLTVSRRHASLTVDSDSVWIEDMGSRYGTVVNGVTIHNRRRIDSMDHIRLGETMLTIELLQTEIDRVTNNDPASQYTIEKELNATDSMSIPMDTSSQDTKKRMEQLFALPTQLGNLERLDSLLKIIVQRLIQLVPGTTRGYVLIQDRKTNDLLLKAHIADTGATVSTPLARRAIASRQAFIWKRSDTLDPQATYFQSNIHTGMYAPMFWKQNVIGVLAVDHSGDGVAYNERDLRWMLAIANFAAMAIASHQLYEELALNTKVLERLLANFSPKIRKKLVEDAQSGKLRPGGDKSDVTLLLVDLRGYTAKVMNLDARDIMDLLHDYFSVLVDIIFKFDGTVDKYIGDAVLAVFGSPDPDPMHPIKAVKAACEMQTAIAELNIKRKLRNDVSCEIGIGIHSGEVIHGFVGTPDRLEFTVIGDVANLTSRYCDGARGGEIVISPEVHQHVYDKLTVEPRTITDKHGENHESYLVKELRSKK